MPPRSADDEILQKLQNVRSRFIERNPKSQALHEEAIKSLPGGGTRSVLYTDPFPLSLKCGRHFKVTTEDGHELVDLLGDFSAGLYGHSHPVIQSTLQHVMDNVGLHMGGTISQEQQLAREICSRFDLDQVRFTNSGTEANLQALAVARHWTGKRKVVVFGDGYHGSLLGFAKGRPAVNNVDMEEWIMARYNDLESTISAIQTPGVAAVLVEGMQCAGGCILGSHEFLSCIQKTSREAGVPFILDEVATSRLSTGGIASLRSIKPDLKTLGKWIGGGAAFGAFGGRADIMAAFDPRLGAAALPHSGTFNNNTLAMHLGHAGLTRIYTREVADAFTAKGDELMIRLNRVAQGTKLSFTGCGTLMHAHFTTSGEMSIANASDVREISELRDLFWFEMLEAGLWIARRGLIALVLDTPEAVLDGFVENVEAFLLKHKALVELGT